MRKITILFLLMGFVVSCNNGEKVDLEKEKKKILKLHHQQRDFHFQKDSIGFANIFTDDFVSVNRGTITSPKKSATISRYHAYFSSVEFIKWDDVSEPIIKFSEDGKLAYTHVDKIVKVRYLSTKDSTSVGETHFAWTAIYRKINDEWKIESVTSTNKITN